MHATSTGHTIANGCMIPVPDIRQQRGARSQYRASRSTSSAVGGRCYLVPVPHSAVGPCALSVPGTA
eukprot:1138465-Rhodomonas_salina.1